MNRDKPLKSAELELLHEWEHPLINQWSWLSLLYKRHGWVGKCIPATSGTCSAIVWNVIRLVVPSPPLPPPPQWAARDSLFCLGGDGWHFSLAQQRHYSIHAEVFFVYSKIEHVENGSVSMVEIPFNGITINRLLLKFHKGNLGALEWLVFHRFLQDDQVKKKIDICIHISFFSYLSGSGSWDIPQLDWKSRNY